MIVTIPSDSAWAATPSVNADTIAIPNVVAVKNVAWPLTTSLTAPTSGGVVTHCSVAS